MSAVSLRVGLCHAFSRAIVYTGCVQVGSEARTARCPGTELTPESVRREVALPAGGLQSKGAGAATGQSGGEAEPGCPRPAPGRRRAVESWEPPSRARRRAAAAAAELRGQRGSCAAPQAHSLRPPGRGPGAPPARRCTPPGLRGRHSPGGGGVQTKAASWDSGSGLVCPHPTLSSKLCSKRAPESDELLGEGTLCLLLRRAERCA